MSDRYELQLPWRTPPLSLNGRMHHMARARLVREVRETAGWLAQAARIPRAERVRVELRYTPRTRCRRDADNLVPTFKALVDGLVDAGVVPDDDDAHVERLMPTITAPGRVAAPLVLVVEALVQFSDVSGQAARIGSSWARRRPSG
ncbi:RusA family crossover junction endodeoxyribonuclease [Pseudonocardia adelaidensis]|uniref:Uncharacterized protein n=1 Tax=Pseudonocardia adelaidensis TaxID=648754 RepID=A0ABP9NUC2_9PSEU